MIRAIYQPLFPKIKPQFKDLYEVYRIYPIHKSWTHAYMHSYVSEQNNDDCISQCYEKPYCYSTYYCRHKENALCL